ncbi:MAG: hypothetical protein ACYTFY_09780 [Planctomycetota bacterium]|jgi:hypothetical protein
MMRHFCIIAAVICVSLLALSQTTEAVGRKGSKGKGKYKPKWNPTSYQKSLPQITIKEGSKKKKYSFEKLILADGYLCPGSAWSYMTLKTALPKLFKNSTPDKKDIKILYGESACAKRVFDYFMGSKYRTKACLECTGELTGRQQAIVRKSTGEKVIITYDKPAADGHNDAGAQAGDAALKASEGKGMVIELVSKK